MDCKIRLIFLIRFNRSFVFGGISFVFMTRRINQIVLLVKYFLSKNDKKYPLIVNRLDFLAFRIIFQGIL